MDKAGIQLGDHLWSIGKVTTEQQEKKILEAGLSSMPVTLFAVSPAEWTKAKIARGPESNTFQPKVRKVLVN